MNLLLKAAIPLVLVATAVGADTLVLRDGRRIEGQLISYQNGIIAFQQSGPGGVYGEVRKDDVLRVEFGARPTAQAGTNARDRRRHLRGLRAACARNK